VGLDCALDGGELDVVGAAHSLFFRGKKTVKSFWRLFYVGRFFLFRRLSVRLWAGPWPSWGWGGCGKNAEKGTCGRVV
jgi:hypothetical protein